MGIFIDGVRENIRRKNNKKIKIWIGVQQKCLHIDLLSRVDFKGNVKSLRKSLF